MVQGQNFRYSSKNSPTVANIFLERKFEKKRKKESHVGAALWLSGVPSINHMHHKKGSPILF